VSIFALDLAQPLFHGAVKPAFLIGQIAMLLDAVRLPLDLGSERLAAARVSAKTLCHRLALVNGRARFVFHPSSMRLLCFQGGE
jgi:hypothetical protein